MIIVKLRVYPEDGPFHLPSRALTRGSRQAGVGPTCHLHASPVCLSLGAVLVLRLVQAGGNSPKRATAPTGGLSSVLRQADRREEAGGPTGGGCGTARSRSPGPVYARGPLGITRRACVLPGSQQGHTVRRHKQMFSGYCCSAFLVIVFCEGQPVGQGARLCCGKELWRDGATECIINQRWLWRLLHTACPAFSLCSMWLEYQQYTWKRAERESTEGFINGVRAVKVFSD